VVGIYEGHSKPDDVNEFLQDFVDEAIELTKSGFSQDGRSAQIIIKGFICDAPARAFITCIKSHTGYYGCGKCSAKGKHLENRVVLLKSDAELRTDTSFRSKIQPQHHTGFSILEKLPVDMVRGFPYEYMHLILLGVTRKLLRLCTASKFSSFKLSPRIIKKISKKLVRVGKSLPVEFVRKQRPLMELDRWKATELRTFLLYTGIIVLPKYLPENHYKLFLCLFYSILHCRFVPCFHL